MKLSNDPREHDGHITLDDGRKVVDGAGKPVIVPYDKWLQELSQNPKKLEAFAKRCAGKSLKPAPVDDDDDSGIAGEDPGGEE